MSDSLSYKETLDRVERLRGLRRRLTIIMKLPSLHPLVADVDWALGIAEYDLDTWPDGVPF